MHVAAVVREILVHWSAESNLVQCREKQCNTWHYPGRLAWKQPTGEFEAAMGVLASLKKLKELRLGGNPARPPDGSAAATTA